ncbi:MAG: hypothetical protein AVDCRST_MAG61-109 [uncultured Friedmanniella sp.]|uniref:Uncharacterized protein n=1 Tax=uncultured Friedmanniella sp. TaxID=335381 RepID=A0A6J4JV85_9ACTN|nr:C40 family peptidase [uncultured Friedmanniella sp.]CAA9288228.1 MAG: hypothetical protein AVDCRST_MAG61-109 [uncultured Friedmanniella sp.]
MTRSLLLRLTATAASAGVLAAGLLGASPAEAATVTGTATAETTIRASAGSKATVLGTLARGQRIPATAKARNGWVQVRFRLQTAYVASAQITTRTTKLPAAPKVLPRTTTKVATARLVVRSGPAKSQAVVGRIAEGSTVKLTGRLKTGYAETVFQQQRRWVSVRYVVSAAKPPAAATSAARGAAAVAFAKAQLGKPYKYGSTGPASFDCSGLTLSAWKAAGVSLPRTSQQQFATGTKVAKADLRAGDLVFFYGSEPTHVAIYVGDGVLIHAARAGKPVEYTELSYMPYSGARRPG